MADRCKHLDFEANVNVARIIDPPSDVAKSFVADVTVKCTACGTRMLFPASVPMGLDLVDGVRRSVDAAELRVALWPEGNERDAFTGLRGFDVQYEGRRSDG